MSAFKVGDKVKLTKNTRHSMVKAGAIGTVVEVQADGGIVASLPYANPFSPALTTMNCWWPAGSRIPLVKVG